jgi:hypothetical protein
VFLCICIKETIQKIYTACLPQNWVIVPDGWSREFYCSSLMGVSKSDIKKKAAALIRAAKAKQRRLNHAPSTEFTLTQE